MPNHQEEPNNATFKGPQEHSAYNQKSANQLPPQLTKADMPQTGAAQDSWAEGWPQAPLAANTWSSAAASSSSVGHSVTAWLEQRFSPDGDLATLLRANFGPIRSDRHQARPSPYPAHHEFEPLERQSQAIGGIVPFPFPGEGAGNSISPPATEASYSSANHPEAASVFHNGIGFGSPPGSQAWLPPPPARTASSPGHMQTTGQQNRLSQFPQRRRIPQACVSCRESKRRCSGTRPCNGCIKRGLGAEDCKYEETESAKQARLDFERCMRTARQGLAPQDISTILSGSSSHHTVPSGHGQSEGNPSLSTSSEYHVGAQAAPHQSAMSSLTSQFEPAQAVGSSSKVGRSIGHDPAWSLQNEDGLAPLSHIPGAAEGYHKKPYPFPAFSHYALPTSGPSLNHLPPSLGSDPHVIVTPLTEIPSAYNDPPEGEPSPGVHIAPDPSFSRTLPLGYHNETWWEELTLMFGSTRRQGAAEIKRRVNMHFTTVTPFLQHVIFRSPVTRVSDPTARRRIEPAIVYGVLAWASLHFPDGKDSGGAFLYTTAQRLHMRAHAALDAAVLRLQGNLVSTGWLVALFEQIPRPEYNAQRCVAAFQMLDRLYALSRAMDPSERELESIREVLQSSPQESEVQTAVHECSQQSLSSRDESSRSTAKNPAGNPNDHAQALQLSRPKSMAEIFRDTRIGTLEKVEVTSSVLQMITLGVKVLRTTERGRARTELLQAYLNELDRVEAISGRQRPFTIRSTWLSNMTPLFRTMITAQLSNRRIEHKGKAPHSQRGDSGDAQSTSGSASMPHSSPNQTSPTVRRTSDVGGSSSSVGLESASVPQDEGPPIPGCSSGPIHTRLDQPGPLRPTQLQPLLIEAEALLGVFETAQKPRRGTLRLLNIVMDNVIALRAKWSSPEIDRRVHSLRERQQRGWQLVGDLS